MGSTDFSAAAAVVRRIVCFIGILVPGIHSQHLITYR